MVQEPDAGELVELWSLTLAELATAGGKPDANALAFALLLKFFQVNGRFPRGRAEFPDDVVGFVAKQVGVADSELGFYEWSGGRWSAVDRRSATCWGSGSAGSPT